MSTDKNIFGEKLKLCCADPLTGFFRDGSCRTTFEDAGKHTVCAIMTDEFLQFSKKQGNDLSTPRPELGFPGLQAGDKWCLCAMRWKEAVQQNIAPPLILEACAEETLEFIEMNTLIKHAFKK